MTRRVSGTIPHSVRCPTQICRSLTLVVWMALLFTLGCRDGSDAHAPSPTQPVALRIASLSPALSQMVREMGHPEALVGRHGFDQWSDDRLPVVGDQAGVDYESLLRVDPTHVLMEVGVGGVPERLSGFAQTHGWTIVQLPTLSLEDVESSAEQIAELLEERDAFEGWRTRWSAALAPAAGLEGERPLLLIGTDPPAALGPGSVHFAMLERMGALPVPSEGGAFQQLSLEDVIALDPTSIVLFSPDAPLDDVASLIGALSRLDIDAVRDRRIVIGRDTMGLVPTTSLVRTADTLRADFRTLMLIDGGRQP